MRWITKLALLLIIALTLLAARTSPRAGALFEGAGWAQRGHADAVAAWALRESPSSVNSPGGAFFDAEWAMGTCQMTVLGLGQVLLQQAELRGRYLPAMERCADWLVSPEARAFGTDRWGSDGFEDVRGGHAYLGYLNLALSMHRLLVPDSEHAAINDRLSRGLAAAMRQPIARFQTYPGETYPVDQSAAAASVALHALATGADVEPLLRDWKQRFRQAAIDPESGMLFQSLDPRSGAAADAPRGSGTALAVYFLGFVDRQLSEQLYRSLVLEQVAGHGGFREYPHGIDGSGDIDSGPVIAGLGVSASGFGLAGARMFGDREAWTAIHRSARTVGLPMQGGDGLWYRTGGAIGNAILLAMTTVTVEPVERYPMTAAR